MSLFFILKSMIFLKIQIDIFIKFIMNYLVVIRFFFYIFFI